MDLNALRVFAKVAESCSFTAAATSLGLTQSGVSRVIRRLEEDLSLRLFNRNTHSVSLTADGSFLAERIKGALADIDDAHHALASRRAFPAGVLRLTTPSALGRLSILPILHELTVRHPTLTVEAVMTDRIVDIVEEGFDAAIRIGSIADTRLIGRHIKMLRVVTVASPSYLNKNGTPKRPNDLLSHNCLTTSGGTNGRREKWQFIEGGQIRTLQVDGSLTLDSADFLVDAALMGSGVVQIMDFSVRNHLARGELIELLTDCAPIEKPVTLLYPESRDRSPKVTTLFSMLKERQAYI